MKLQEWRNETPENEQMYEDIKGIAGMGNFLKGMFLAQRKCFREYSEKNKAEIIGVFSTSEICGSISFTLIVRWYVILFSQV